ncbi:LysM peptidoglycan-binding domain-containing protein [Desulfococcus multivorans]|uniref:LysM peptidoglycan-binding domain-containing protein n=1 Tax=Desulfococcus multivorans TaxID=897 RepID=UPI00099AAA4E|nr:LysM peptidoglycan-binding domain-containing protein [Desulfococcus multivorans]SKA29210.1 membrane-bound lytic murein transglycosylase D [Desulfococcus multivorans DSM 2059]
MNTFRSAVVLCCLLVLLVGCSTPSKNQNAASPRQPTAEKRTVAQGPSRTPASDTVLLSTPPDMPLDPQSHAIINKAVSYCRKSQTCWQKEEIEEALAALDKAYALLLKLDDEDDPDMVKRKEDLRFLISKRILEIYASRNTTAKGHRRAIPIEINRHVQKEIDYLTKGDFFVNAYRRSGRYRAHISQELSKAGLPPELSWLPLIESGYNVRALSSARALGLWQFIPSTGYRFGLNRDRYVDERMNPYKSTQAAIAYLKALHDMFGDWTTVLAAYNCGEGRVLRVIRAQQINYLDNFWDLYEQLPNETARYVPRFLATLHIVNNAEKYGIDKVKPYRPIPYETVTVSKQVSLADLATHLDVPGETLKELNAELRQGILPGTPYELKVPPKKERLVLAKLHDIPVASPPRTVKPTVRSRKSPPAVVYHRVQRGDTLTEIARAYRTDVDTIKRANGLKRSNVIALGKVLKIPGGKTPTAMGKSAPAVAYHRVKRGDTLTEIARAYRTDVDTIKRANGLKRSNVIALGKVLKIPGGKTPTPPENEVAAKRRPRQSIKYVVQRGDTLWNIAKRNGVSTQKIMRANGMKNKKVLVGQTLRIPHDGAGGTTIAANDALKTYRVKSGDAPMDIAKRHKMTLQRFLHVNNLTHDSKIYPGQKVSVE